MKTSDATLKLLASDSYLVDRGGMQVFWGWYTYNVHFESGEEGGKVKMRCYRSQGGGGIEGSGRPIFILFLVKKIGFAPWPGIMLIIYHWQEIFLLILKSDREAIL